MRCSIGLLAVLVAVAGCKPDGSGATASAKAEPSATAAAAAPSSTAAAAVGATASADTKANANVAADAAGAARYGGQVVVVDRHTVELKLYERGLAEAWVLDAGGKPVSDEKVKLSLRAAGAETGGIRLGFQPASARFAGRAAGEERVPGGPLDVVLTLANGESVKAKLEAPVLLAGPSIGGTLVVAGKHGVEIAVGADGKVEALVHDAAGVRADTKLKLEVKLSAADGSLHTVALAWDEALGRFAGQLKAGVEVSAGPAELLVDGAVAAKIPKLALRASAKHGGRLVAAGDYTLELVAEAEALVAYVFDAKASAHAAGDLDIDLELGGHRYKLVWDAPSLSYRAKVDGEIDLGAELSVVVKAGGTVYAGVSAPSVKADAAADLDVSAKAKAKVDVKVPKPEVKVEKGASASAGKGKAKAKAKVSIGF